MLICTRTTHTHTHTHTQWSTEDSGTGGESTSEEATPDVREYVSSGGGQGGTGAGGKEVDDLGDLTGDELEEVLQHRVMLQVFLLCS